MNYEAIIHAVVDSIVENPDSILIRTISEDEKDVVLLIASDKEDTARLIGRKGSVANAIREVMSVIGKSEGRRIHLKFESFDNGEDEED